MYMQVFVGKANVLHVELCKHFENFAKKREDIREIDDELCHHTDASGWEITVWPLQVQCVLPSTDTVANLHFIFEKEFRSRSVLCLVL